MKKRLFIVLLLSTFLFTSCLDIVQYISIDGDQVDINFKFTIQKMMFELAGAFGGEPVNYDEMLMAGDEITEGFSAFVHEYNQINSMTEIGAEFKVSGTLDDFESFSATGETIPFVPRKVNGVYELYIESMTKDPDNEDDWALAFLSSAKQRIMVDKSGPLKNITGFEIVSLDGVPISEVDELEFLLEDMIFDYGSMIVLELPLLYMFMVPEGFIIRLVE